jgi:flagella basal body P-ring formation protein FlgA
MILRCLITCCWFVPCVLAQTPCLSVTGDQILGSDFARAVPAFAHISPNSPLAQSPMPGNTRVFHLSELQSIGAHFSIPISSPQEVCFRFETQPLNPDRIAEAMRNALQIPDARIEVLETSPATAPAGTIEFTRDNLGVPAASDSKTPVPWRGDVVYAGNRRFPIWSKVRISAPIAKVTAVEGLRPGVTIKPDQVRMDLVEGFPQPASRIVSIDQLAGMTVLRPIAAGTELRQENLTRPNDVNRGDTVLVEVRFGAAHLALTGRAESAGHRGDVVEVRNPDTSKVFQARVEGPDRVMVGPPLQ